MPIPTTSMRSFARAEPHPYADHRTPTLRQQVEEVTKRFLDEHRERILRAPNFVSRDALLRHQLLKKQFDVLEADYLKRVRVILWNKDQIDKIYEGVRLLSKYSARRGTKASSVREIEKAMKELETREADEQEMLEEAHEVAMDIIYLGTTQA